MGSLTKKAAQVKVSKAPRALRWAPLTDCNGWLGGLTISQGKETDTYLVSHLDADFGRGFRLTHLTEGQSYDVNVTEPRGHSSCECLGFTHWGKCKHVSALIRMIDLRMV
jgi:hypothetical protein